MDIFRELNDLQQDPNTVDTLTRKKVVFFSKIKKMDLLTEQGGIGNMRIRLKEHLMRENENHSEDQINRKNKQAVLSHLKAVAAAKAATAPTEADEAAAKAAAAAAKAAVAAAKKTAAAKTAARGAAAAAKANLQQFEEEMDKMRHANRG